MTPAGKLIGWSFVLFVVVGLFLAWLRVRDWWISRTWVDVSRVRWGKP